MENLVPQNVFLNFDGDTKELARRLNDVLELLHRQQQLNGEKLDELSED